MSPKFLGGSDDWLDDEDEGVRGRGLGAKHTEGQKAESLPPDQANASVVEVFIGQCRARLDDGSPPMLCSYRRKAVLGSGGGTGRADLRERTPVAVGDRIRVNRTSPDQGVVAGVCSRRNALTRHAAGRELQQVVAANVDGLAIVASAQDPTFSPGLVDRYLVAASSAAILPLICVTKVDLLPEGAGQPWGMYSDLGAEVRQVSSTRGDGIDLLRERLTGMAWVFCGQSGVGKTSLLSALIGQDAGRIGSVSSATRKGQHTTTQSIMLPGPKGSSWIDTPGVREFGLKGITAEQLGTHFPELSALPCSRRGCLHDGEPDCDADDVSTPRLASYRRILESLRQDDH